jgi:hypothetical protein
VIGFSDKAERLGPTDHGAEIYWHREQLWLIQPSVRTIPGFFRLWGEVQSLSGDTSDERLGAAVRQALESAPRRRIPHDYEPEQTPWSMVGKGYRSFCRRTALVSAKRAGEHVIIAAWENRMFVKPDPAFYPRTDLDVTLPANNDDVTLGRSVREAAAALPTPL